MPGYFDWSCALRMSRLLVGLFQDCRFSIGTLAVFEREPSHGVFWTEIRRKATRLVRMRQVGRFGPRRLEEGIPAVCRDPETGCCERTKATGRVD